MAYFVDMFQGQVTAYITRLLGEHQPALVIACMLYYPDEANAESWAGHVLELMGYNAQPGKVQWLIKTLFEVATSKIEVPGVPVVPLPLFQVLDSKETADYVHRVEPSVQGGEKMGRAIVDAITGG